VVNIITKDPKKKLGNWVRYQRGTGNHQFYTMGMGKSWDDKDSGFTFTYSHLDEDLARSVAPVKEFQLLSNIDYYNRSSRQIADNLYARMSFREAFLNFHYSHHDPTAPMSQSSNLGGDDSHLTTDRTFVVTGVDHAFLKNLKLNLKGSYDRYQFA